MPKLTPMMEQYFEIKNKYRDVELKIYGEKLEERIGVDE